MWFDMGWFAHANMELTDEEVDEVIEKAAYRIHQYKMETVAILTLESIKPMVYIGGELSRFAIAPFLPALGPAYNELGEKLLYVFEDRKNIEKLIVRLEEMVREEEKQKEQKKQDEKEEPSDEENIEKEELPEEEPKPEKKGWRRYLPF
jgi:ABC-type Zn2+ transport system substrate-binding protein/surface adhesin